MFSQLILRLLLPGWTQIWGRVITSAAPSPTRHFVLGGGWVAESLMLMVFAQILQGCRGFIQPWGEQTTSLQPKKPFPARLREGTTAPLGSSEHTPGHVISEAALWQRRFSRQ